MNRAERRRWTILLAALALTLGTVLYPVDDPAVEPAAIVAAVAQKSGKANMNVSDAHSASVETAHADGIPDPFSPRGWQAPPAPEPPPPPVAPAPPPPVQAGPPPLPFQYMGRLDDDGVEAVYVSHGERSWAVRAGETLDGTYKVLNLEPQHIEFEYLPTGARQTLFLPAPEK